MLIFRNFTVFLAFFYGVSSMAQQELLSHSDSILKSDMENSKKVLFMEELLAQEIPDSLRADIYYEYSKWHWSRNRNQSKAKEIAIRERGIRKKDSQRESKIKRNLYNLGYMHHHSSYPDQDNALAYFDTLISLSPQSEVRIGNAYREKGDIYEELGDSQKALENYVYSELIFKEADRPDLRLKTLINIAATYAGMEQGKYLRDFQDNLSKINELGPSYISNRQKGLLSLNSSAMYYVAKEYSEAFAWAQKSLNIFKEDKDSTHIFNSLNLLGLSQKKLGDAVEAEGLFNKAELFARNPLEKSIVSNNRADIYLQNKDYEKAIAFYTKAIKTLLGSSNPEATNPVSLITYENAAISPYKVRLFGYLNDLSGALLTYWNHTGNDGLLVKANSIVEVADALVDDLFIESSEELSKLHWREKSANLYMNGIAIAQAMGMPDKALYYMEKNKGLLLLENITNVSARQKVGIPSAVVSREYDLLSQIKKLESQWAGKETADSIKRGIFQLKQDYVKFIDSLDHSFPSYFKFRKRLSITSLETIQEELQKDEVVLSYAMDTDRAYVIYLTQSEIILKSLPISVTELKQGVNALLEKMKAPFYDNEAITDYRALSEAFFHAVFPFENREERLYGKTVFIVPDGDLHKIPFEALSTNREGSLSESYLLNKANISYKYSLSVESQLEILAKAEQKSTVGFFPGRFKEDYQDPLVRSEQERSLLTVLLNAEVHENGEASKDAFLEAYDANSVIHVSTHGGIGEEGPWLAFYDEPLFLNDLYFLKHQKELVVLSACKTSTGDLKKGEGVFSLTRGFINAGAKSIVSTLWDVNEKSSLEVTSSFYDYLKKGDSKSEALQKAKLVYLEKYANTSESSPYYWSAITLTGNDAPIYTPSFFEENRTAILVGLLTVFLAAFWVRRTRQKKSVQDR